MTSSLRVTALLAVLQALAACSSSVSPPVAIATGPASGAIGVPVQLDGTKSTDPQGRSLSYGWALISTPAGSTARLNDTASMTPSFVPDVAGNYLARLVVSNGILSSDPVSASVTIANCGRALPFAVLVASPQTVYAGRTVTLSASVTDPNTACGLIESLTYAWTLVAKPAGSQALLSQPNAATPTFVADRVGSYQIALVVTDSSGNVSPTAYLTMSTAPCGTGVPVASISPASSAAAPITTASKMPVTLTASALDPDNDPSVCPSSFAVGFGYAWSLLSRPPGSGAVLSGAGGNAVTLVPDAPGDYLVQAVATASNGISGQPVTALVRASVCGLVMPTVTASATPATPNAGDLVSLVPTVSDPNLAPPCALPATISYSWTLLVRPAGSQAVLSNPVATAPTFRADKVGAYQASVVATDSLGNVSAPAYVNVTTSACGTGVPSASVVASFPTASTVTLTATATDPDNTACPPAFGVSISFAWQLTSWPVGSRAQLNGTAGPSVTFVPDLAGSYVAQVVPTASNGISGQAVAITIIR